MLNLKEMNKPRKSFQMPYQIIPENIPNEGILFVDHEKNSRSHGGHAVTECLNGDIIAFYMNTWAEHEWQAVGLVLINVQLTEENMSEPVDFKYSLDVWNKYDSIFSDGVWVITAPDGNNSHRGEICRC